SESVEAFDSHGNPLKGLRRNTTQQVATFNLVEPIVHPDITADESLEFESWRDVQLKRIQKAYIEHAAAGKLGGYPLLKTKSGMGDELAKVGEFSGIISTMIEVQPSMIKNVMNGKKQADDQHQQGMSLDERVASEAICERIKEISEDIMRYMSITNRKGTEIYTIQQTLDMRAAWNALGCTLDSRGIGYQKVTGVIDGRNAAEEGAEIFSEIKKKTLG
ncbi:TPA: hypothetical protein VDT73_006329, partial [Pseudomonas aeruginosa]|nr:hypothetical protein [Pseudomonas aeruginosa]